MRNPKTSRLIRLLDGTPLSLRLTPADRVFLRSLARLQIISHDLANKHHYAHLKGGADRPLWRLTRAGVLSYKVLHVPGQPSVRTYEFATDAIAKAWGGARPITGAKRSDFHELITTRLYYALDQPSDFRLARNFSKSDHATIRTYKPDALFSDHQTGELVFVEADAGHYSRSQIVDKVARWHTAGYVKQVWGQPLHNAATIPTIDGISVFRF